MLSRIPVSILGGPFEFMVAVASVMLAAIVFVMALGGGITSLPFWLVCIWTAMFLAGGLAVIVGMLRRGNAHDPGIVAESVGLVLLGTGWAVYAVGVAFGSGLVGPIIAAAAILGASGLRLYAIRVAARVVRSTAAIRAETG